MGKLENVGAFSLTVEFHDRRDNFTWRCTSVYGPNARDLKQSFWEELRNCRGDPLVLGLFAGISMPFFSLEDKPKGIRIFRSYALLTGF